MHQTQVSTIIFGLLMKYGEWLDTYTIICNNSDKHTTVNSLFATTVYSLYMYVHNATFFGGGGVRVKRL